MAGRGPHTEMVPGGFDPPAGAIGGIAAAIDAADGAVLTVPWDTPFVPASLLRALRETGELHDVDAVVLLAELFHRALDAVDAHRDSEPGGGDSGGGETGEFPGDIVGVADEALERVVDQAEKALRVPATAGERFTPGVLAEPAEIGIRLIGAAIRRVSDGAALELNRLEALHAAFSDASRAGKSLQRSLGGAIIALDRQGGITISREPPRRSRLSLGKGPSGA